MDESDHADFEEHADAGVLMKAPSKPEVLIPRRMRTMCKTSETEKIQWSGVPKRVSLNKRPHKIANMSKPVLRKDPISRRMQLYPASAVTALTRNRR
jgi:hypothetical protein